MFPKKHTLTTRVSGTKHNTFNVPNTGDRVILIPNNNSNDSNEIIVLNEQVQQIGYISKLAGLNKKVAAIIDWKPYIAKVIAVFPSMAEIFIEIDMKQINPYQNLNLMMLKENIYLN